MMRMRLRACAPPALALGAVLALGCGRETNEEGLIVGTARASAPKEVVPNFHSQGEYEAWRAEQSRKNRPAGKVKGKGKAKSTRKV